MLLIFVARNIQTTIKKYHHKLKFDIYFSLSLEEVIVSDSVIQNVISSYEETEILSLVKRLKSEDSIDYLIEELECRIEQIPPDRITIFVKLFISLSAECFNDIGKRSLYVTKSMCIYLIPKLMTRISQVAHRFDILMQILEDVSLYELEAILPVIRDLEEAFGRWPSSYEDINMQFLSLDKFLILENAISDKIIRFEKQKSIFDWTYYLIALKILEINNEEKYKEFFNEMLRTPLNRLKRLELTVGTWRGQGEGYYFDLGNISKEIEYSSIKQDIITTLQDESFWTMSQDQQRIVATYEVCNQRSNEENIRVSYEDADLQLCIWGKKG